MAYNLILIVKIFCLYTRTSVMGHFQEEKLYNGYFSPVGVNFHINLIHIQQNVSPL